MPFDTTVEILIFVFLALATFCIGLSSRVGEMLGLLRDRGQTLRVLTANILIAPIVALILVGSLPMNPAAASVLLLLAFAPGGINAVQFTTKAPGQATAAGALLVMLSLIGIIAAPIAAPFILESEAPVELPGDQLAFRIVALIVTPFLVGLAVRAFVPDIAERTYKPAMLVSTLAFIASVVLSLDLRQTAMGGLGASSAVAMLLFIVIMMAVGWFFGGPEDENRQVLAVSSNLRNVGLTYVIVGSCCTDPMLETAVLAFMAIMVFPNLLLTVFCAIRRRCHAH